LKARKRGCGLKRNQIRRKPKNFRAKRKETRTSLAKRKSDKLRKKQTVYLEGKKRRRRRVGSNRKKGRIRRKARSMCLWIMTTTPTELKIVMRMWTSRLRIWETAKKMQQRGRK